jgi:hypothetical protein
VGLEKMMSARAADLAFAAQRPTILAYLRARFGILAQRLREQRAERAAHRCTARQAAADRDANRLYWRD